MRVGYGRTSTTDQVAGLEAQRRDLIAQGCEEIYVEQVSAKSKSRPQLEAAIRFIRAGDELVVTRPDRLARSVGDLLKIKDRVTEKGASLVVISLGVNTADATGNLILNVLASIAEFERDLMLERQREGIAEAKAAGLYKGRKPTARAKAADVYKLDDERVPKTEIASRLGISRASVHRILGARPPRSVAPAGRSL